MESVNTIIVILAVTSVLAPSKTNVLPVTPRMILFCLETKPVIAKQAIFKTVITFARTVMTSVKHAQGLIKMNVYHVSIQELLI